MAGKVGGPSGPGSGPPPVGGPEDKSGSPAGAGGAKFADKLAATDPTRRAGDPAAAAASAARGPKGIELTADVAAELAAGRIDAKAALDRVIERVLDKQLGPGAPSEVREKVRAALESAVADDPILGDKIRSLTTR